MDKKQENEQNDLTRDKLSQKQEKVLEQLAYVCVQVNRIEEQDLDEIEKRLRACLQMVRYKPDDDREFYLIMGMYIHLTSGIEIKKDIQKN